MTSVNGFIEENDYRKDIPDSTNEDRYIIQNKVKHNFKYIAENHKISLPSFAFSFSTLEKKVIAVLFFTVNVCTPSSL